MLLCSVALVFGTACGEDEEAAPPTGSIVFAHQDQQQGQLEFLFNDTVQRKISVGDISSAVTIPVGQATIAVRSPGAPQALLSETYDFDAQLYLAALTNTGGEASIFFVDNTPPEIPEGMHALEVVSLRAPTPAFNVFADQTELASSPALNSATNFVLVEAGETNVSVANPEGGSFELEKQTFAAGGASMIIISGGGDEFGMQFLTVK